MPKCWSDRGTLFRTSYSVSLNAGFYFNESEIKSLSVCVLNSISHLRVLLTSMPQRPAAANKRKVDCTSRDECGTHQPKCTSVTAPFNGRGFILKKNITWNEKEK